MHWGIRETSRNAKGIREFDIGYKSSPQCTVNLQFSVGKRVPNFLVPLYCCSF